MNANTLPLYALILILIELLSDWFEKDDTKIHQRIFIHIQNITHENIYRERKFSLNFSNEEYSYYLIVQTCFGLTCLQIQQLGKTYFSSYQIFILFNYNL